MITMAIAPAAGPRRPLIDIDLCITGVYCADLRPGFYVSAGALDAPSQIPAGGVEGLEYDGYVVLCGGVSRS